MVPSGKSLRRLESERPSLMDSWKAYAVITLSSFRMLTVPRHSSWVGEEHSSVSIALKILPSRAHTCRPALPSSRSSTKGGPPDWLLSPISILTFETLINNTAKASFRPSLSSFLPSLILATKSSPPCIRHMLPVCAGQLMLHLPNVSKTCLDAENELPLSSS